MTLLILATVKGLSCLHFHSGAGYHSNVMEETDFYCVELCHSYCFYLCSNFSWVLILSCLPQLFGVHLRESNPSAPTIMGLQEG